MKTTAKTFLPLYQLALAACALACAVAIPQAAAGPFGWSTSDQVKGSGQIKRETRDVGHFRGVALALPANVELRVGNSESVTIETDDNLLPLIETEVENGTLKIRTVKKNLNLQTRSMKIVVQARAIDHLAVAGSGSLDADALQARNLKLDLGGSGSINVKKIESEALSVTLGGAGNLKTGGGAARQLSVSIGGSGDVDLGQLKADSASVNVAGSGEATVWARDALNLNIAGSGDVKYYGDPKISKSVLGSGAARRIGDAPHL